MYGPIGRSLRSVLLMMGVLGAIAASSAAAATPASAQVSADEAVSWARGQVGRTDMELACDCFVAQAYGYGGSGHETANDHWMAIPWANSHPPDPAPPAGALVFYDTYAPYGHVAISVGGGRVISTNVDGAVRETDIGHFAGYRGWTDALFPNAWGSRTGVCAIE